MAQIVTMHRR